MLKVIMNRLYKRYSPDGYAAATDEGLDVGVDVDVGTRLLKEKVRRCDEEGRKITYELLVKCSYVDNRYRADLKPEDSQCARALLLDEIDSHIGLGGEYHKYRIN